MNGGTIIIDADDEDLDPGEYELVLEIFDLNDPDLITRHIHTLIITIKEVNQDCNTNNLPMIILEPG